MKTWTEGVEFEDEARRQLEATERLPIVSPYVAVMPDVHAGIGSTVGSVVPTVGAIIPACVGVDIGCGMNAVRLNLRAEHLPDKLGSWREKIEKAVPHGSKKGDSYVGNWGNVPAYHKAVWERLDSSYNLLPADARSKLAANQLGTLGGGNHFIELCVDESQGTWLVVHSGSRGMGNRIGQYYISKAREKMQELGDLAYLVESDPLFTQYWNAVKLAQTYARLNRDLMIENSLRALGLTALDEIVSCHHNYIAEEEHYGKHIYVTRKGAVRAGKGELGIIPGSMGAKSYIVRGKGNPESFCSCSHGAGRRMSRSKAKQLITLEEHVKATEGVACRKDLGVVDESPAAYKDIDKVMAAQQDLVEIVHTLKQVICVKG